MNPSRDLCNRAQEMDKMSYAYKEIAIEDLTINPGKILREIFETSGLELNIPDVSHLKRERHARNRPITKEEIQIIRNYFPDAI